MSKLTILQVNCTDDKGRNIKYDQIDHMLRTLSNTLEEHGLKDFLIIPKYGSLGEITTLSLNDPLIVQIDEHITKFTLKELIGAINIKLRESSDTEDGILSDP